MTIRYEHKSKKSVHFYRIMFSGLANYLFGSTNSDTDNNCSDDNKKRLNQVEDTSHHHNNRNSVDDLKFLSIEAEEDDWLIVDKEGK